MLESNTRTERLSAETTGKGTDGMTVYYEIHLEEERGVKALRSLMDRASREGRVLRWTLDGPARSPVRLRCEWNKPGSTEVHTCIFVLMMRGGGILLTDPSAEDAGQTLFIAGGGVVLRLMIEASHPSATPLSPTAAVGAIDPGLSWGSLAEP